MLLHIPKTILLQDLINYVEIQPACWDILGCIKKRGCVKGHLISKTNCQAKDSPKKRTNEFVFTTVRRVFVCFLGESLA